MADEQTGAEQTGSEPERANARKVREGLVVSDAMDATVIVAVIERVRHPRYGKTVQRTKRLYAHDADNSA
jgi:small subunit ribosomal protein S17